MLEEKGTQWREIWEPMKQEIAVFLCVSGLFV